MIHSTCTLLQYCYRKARRVTLRAKEYALSTMALASEWHGYHVFVLDTVLYCRQ